MVRPHPQAQRDDPAHCGHFFGEALIDSTQADGQVAQVNALPSCDSRSSHDVLVDLFRHEWREGGAELGDAYQALIERRVRIRFISVKLALPEPLAAAAHVPVRKRVDELAEFRRGFVREEGIHVLPHPARQDVELGQDPAVQQGSFRGWAARHRAGVEAVDLGVDGEEGVDVPELERKLLLDHANVRQRVARRRPWRVAGQEEPAECIRAGRRRRRFQRHALACGKAGNIIR